MTALFPFVKLGDFEGAIKKGQWKKDLHGRVFCCCPGCGITMRINHKIDEGGRISPSMDCPTEICHFHRFVVLLDWESD